MTRKLHISKELSLPIDAVTGTIVVYGNRGMGKTNFGSVLAEELSKARLHFAIIDPMGVWWGLQSSKDGKGPGIPVLLLGGLRGDLPIEPTAGAVVADLVVDERVSCVIDISRHANGKAWTVGEKVKFVTEYTYRLYERQVERSRPLLQIYDEAARYAPQTMPTGAKDIATCLSAISQLVEEGRNIGVGCVLLTQRSARMAKSVSELAECMIAFRTIGPNSVGAVTDWLGEYVEKQRIKDMTGTLRSLPIGNALVVSPGWLGFEGVVRFRERETFDSSKTPKPGERRLEPVNPAKPNLKKYRELMAATVERAIENDPKTWKKRLNESLDENKKLRRDVERLTNAQSSASPSSDVRTVERELRREQAVVELLRKELQEAMKFILKINAEDFVSKPGQPLDETEVREALSGAVDNIRSLVEKKLDSRNKELQEARKEGQKIIRRLEKLLGEDSIEVDVTVKHQQPFAVSSKVSSPHKSAPAPVRASSNGSDPSLNKGELAILRAVVQFGSVTEEQIAVLTGYKQTSRYEYLRSLRAKGMVLQNGDSSEPTELGISSAGEVEKPPVGDELIEWWHNRLSGGEQKIFDYIASRDGKLVTKDELQQHTEYKNTSIYEYSRKLAARKLIESTKEGYRLSSVFQ